MQTCLIRPLKALALPLDRLDSEYDAVVVGSGYGGSIAASRLARAGLRVAVLERGRELLPGQYPESIAGARPQVQMTGRRRQIGDRSGLYWFHADGDISVFGGCGLGGGSLVNAGVALRPDPRVFQDPVWPSALREDMSRLEEAYSRAEAMLRPAPFPDSLPEPPKVSALRELAGPGEFSLTAVNVAFTAGPSPAGIDQPACHGCGDCITGCNSGAKNTLLMNYLPDAVGHGARVFTQIEARWVEKHTSGWVVMAHPLHSGREELHGSPLPIRTSTVVLAAGTLGSTAILLRSAARGLPVSARLGQGFSGNGDVLGYALYPRRVVGGVARRLSQSDPGHATGPCISAMVDNRASVPLRDGTVIEDAVIPTAIAGLVPELLLPEIAGGWLQQITRGSGPIAWLASALTHGRHGLMQRLQTFLVMGHDDAGGSIRLNPQEEPCVEWPTAGSTEYYRAANERLRELSRRGAARFLPDPLWNRLLHYRLVTVHPLGGCPMGEDAGTGVVDDTGAVFTGEGAGAVHPGLYVWDGSIIPTSLGVNPLLTISALAERAVSRAADAHGWTIDYSPGPGEPAPETIPGPARPTLTFTERMSGWWSTGVPGEPADIEDYRRYEERGQADGSRLSFVLTITAPDATALEDLSLPFVAVGTVEAPALSPEPLLVTAGQFRLLVADDTDDPTLSHMYYDLPLETVEGRRFHFHGFKKVRPAQLADMWPDTTTLYATFREGGADGRVVGAGILRISPGDFAHQLRTMSVRGDLPSHVRLELLARFGRVFAGAVWNDYGSVVNHSVASMRPTRPRHHRPLDVPRRQVIGYSTADGVKLRLTRYQGGGRGPVVLVHGMGANPLTFSLDTISPNLVEYLVSHGFDVWLQEWRGSTALSTCRNYFDADQVARLDHPAAEAAVRAETGRQDIHWVTHCVGSITWCMATLAAVVRPASLLCSQVAAHPIGPGLTRIKAGMHAPDLLRRLGVGLLTTDAFQDETWTSALFDQLLRFYPVPREERCQHAVCRRLAFIYGIAVHRDAVDDTTHALLHELFGPTNMQMMGHLARMAREQRLVAAGGGDEYMEGVDRLRLPLTMIHGAHNRVWVPESTARTAAWIGQTIGAAQCRRVVLSDHGHQDSLMGATAHRDAFPAVIAHLYWAGA